MPCWQCWQTPGWALSPFSGECDLSFGPVYSLRYNPFEEDPLLQNTLRQYLFWPECLGCGTRVRTRNTHAHYTHNTHTHTHTVRMQAGKELRPGTACIPEKKALSANTPTFLSSASVASANAGLVWASASASSPTAIERGGSLGRLGRS